MLKYFLFLSSPGHSAVLWLPGLHLWYFEASQPQVWSHGPLCKVLPDPAAGGQPSGGRSPQCSGGQQGLEGSTRGLGVATYGSLRLCSPGLERLQGMKDYTDWDVIKCFENKNNITILESGSKETCTFVDSWITFKKRKKERKLIQSHMQV